MQLQGTRLFHSQAIKKNKGLLNKGFPPGRKSLIQ